MIIIYVTHGALEVTVTIFPNWSIQCGRHFEVFSGEATNKFLTSLAIVLPSSDKAKHFTWKYS
jgi:hypothetical protein